MDEIELKFEVPAAKKTALLTALRRGKVSEQRLQAIYFDTPDELLARHRMAVRLRKEGAEWVQTLKGSTADSMRRLEHNAVRDVEAGLADGVGDPAAPTLDLSLHVGTPAGDALHKVMHAASGKHKASKKTAKIAKTAPASSSSEPVLAPRYSTDVLRISRAIRFEGAVIEAAFDVGNVIAGGRRTPICELEFELKAGSADRLVALAQRWIGPHGLSLSTVSKAERGTRLARGQVHGEPAKAAQVEFDRHATPGQVLRAVAGNCLDQITVNASEVAAGSEDDDHVHQLRVGIRRLRTALREMADFDQPPGPPIDPAWEPALRAAFAELGEVRDRKTVMAQLEPHLDAAGAPQSDAPPQAGKPATERTPAQTVASPGFQVTVLQLLGFCASLVVTDDEAVSLESDAERPDAARLFSAHLSRLHRQIKRDGKRFAKLDPTSQHRVRKRLKRLRYLAEFAAPLFDRKKVERYLAELRPAQDLLGVHNDEVVALQAYRKDASIDHRAAFATGWLSARQEDGSSQCQQALEHVGEAPKFWK